MKVLTRKKFTGTVDLDLSTGTISVPAYIEDGLAITPVPLGPIDLAKAEKFQVVHVRSGKTVHTIGGLSMNEAYRLLKGSAKYVDWTRDASEVNAAVIEKGYSRLVQVQCDALYKRQW